ncbi:MAG TPA: hypothetical protein VNW72_00450 [Chthoniobacterales bacterium]|nr:hypothetical protein [Chthoniobacterales bacterium]
MKTFKVPVWASLSVLFALCCAAHLGYAEGSAIVEIPTAKNIDASDPGQNLTMAGEYKSAKNVVEEQKPVCWTWAFDVGYMSEYNFRGTNLTPDADGAGLITLEVSRWGFTFGVTGIHQFGTAHSDSFSIGEGGGGGANAFGTGLFANPLPIGPRFIAISSGVSPHTIQDRFNEIDIFLQYQRSFGWIDIAVGNIGFFIDRQAVTFVDLTNIAITVPPAPPIPLGSAFHVGPLRTVEDEKFDRFYLTLSSSKIPHLQPVITYYQTVVNDGSEPAVLGAPLAQIFEKLGFPPGLVGGLPTVPAYRGRERNDELGGYLEGRLRGNFAVTEWLSLNPQGVISASFHDRTEPIVDPINKKDAVRGRSLSGWNVAQLGLDIPIRVLHLMGFSDVPCAPPDLNVYITPFAWYSYHISDPTPSTDRNEFWGGVKLTATF